MKSPFEFAPLLISAIIGASVLYIATPSTQNNSTTTTLMTGAGVGLAVQIGVRILGVS